MRYSDRYQDLLESGLADLEDRQVMCPFVRTFRIYEALCAYEPDNASCRLHPPQRARYVDVLAHAEREKMCALELNNTLESLAYTPVEIDPIQAMRNLQ